MRVLITGAGGRLGRRATRALETDHDLVLGDVKPLGDARFISLDVTDGDAVHAGVQGCDAVIHMAMLDWFDYSPEGLRRYTLPALQVQVLGLANVLQAALETGVRRILYTSTVSAVDGIAPDTPIDSETRHYSNTAYGLTKGFGEDLCRMFHHAWGLSVLVLRLGNLFVPEGAGGWVGNLLLPDLSGPIPPASSRVHVDDVTRAIALALEVPEPACSLVHLVGDNPGRQWDLAAARRVLGWSPRWSFGPDGLPRAAPV